MNSFGVFVIKGFTVVSATQFLKAKKLAKQ